MKIKLRTVLLAASLLAMPVVFSGMTCTPSQQRQIFNTISTELVTARNAYDAFLDNELRQATPNLSNIRAASNAFNSVQLAAQIAIAAAHGNTNAIAPPDLITKRVTAVQTFDSLRTR